ncbi:hypothetical protein LJC27_04855 [Christensenellaceae bacterium OttesenSCG-928-M15]|nr:hypothetical protein [Christensenellaceae bacterium OttesenSCG-928-M15]
MKNKLSPYLPLIVLSACLLIIGGLLISVACLKNAGTYALETVEGDPAALKGLSISLRFDDQAHTQFVTLKDGELLHSYQGRIPQNYHAAPNISMSYELYEHEDANVESSVRQVEDRDAGLYPYTDILTRNVDLARVVFNISGIELYRQYTFLSDIVLHDETKSLSFVWERSYGQRTAPEESKKPFHYMRQWYAEPMSVIGWEDWSKYYAISEDGDIYFTLPVKKGFGGQSGIYRMTKDFNPAYELKRFEKDGYRLQRSLPSEDDFEQFPLIAPIPLDSEDIVVLRLDTIDDKLLLLFVEGTTLKLRIFSLSGEELGELALCEVDERFLADDGRHFISAEGFLQANSACYSIYYGFSTPYNLDGTPVEDMDPEGDYPADIPPEEYFAIDIDAFTMKKSMQLPDGGDPNTLFIGYENERFIVLSVAWSGPPGGGSRSPIEGLAAVSVLGPDGAVEYNGIIKTGAFQDYMQSMIVNDPADAMIYSYYGGMYDMASRFKRVPSVISITGT